MTPLVFGSAGMFIDAAAALPSSGMKSRRFQLIEQHSRRQGRIAGYRIGRISERKTEPLHNPLLADLRPESVWDRSRNFDRGPATSGSPRSTDVLSARRHVSNPLVARGSFTLGR